MSQFYKDQTRTEVRVGIVTLVGLAILFAGYAWLREAFETSRQQVIRVHFDHAANLEPGDAVSVLGVKSGKVRSLTVTDRGVIAELAVRLDVTLHEGTRFLIKENNLMGDRGVDILPGPGPVALDLAQVQSGETRIDLNEFVAGLGDVVGRIDSLLAGFEGSGQFLATLGEVADSSKILLRNADRFISSTDRDLKSVLGSISNNSRELSEIMTENRGAVSNSFNSLEQILGNLRADYTRLDRILERADTLSASLGNREGTVSRLLRDRELYDRLLRSSTELDSLLKDVRKHPRRYFKFSVF